MAQYETVNGVPKLISKSKGRYLDKDGQLKDVKDLADYEALVKTLSENGQPQVPDVGTTWIGPPPRRAITSIAISVAYPYINYHARYMRECTQIASEWLVRRLMRQKDLMRGISAYKDHVNTNGAEPQPA